MKPLSTYLRELSWQLQNALPYAPTLARKQGLRNLSALLATFNTAQTTRLAQLQQQYAVDDWPRLCSKIEYIENLYVLDILEQSLGKARTQSQGLDIGCRNFSHLPALTAFSAGPWDGVELAANARYLNGYTRRAYGQWMARQRVGCRYIPGSLLDLSGCYHTIVWTLPFVVPEPLQAWGLPLRYFQPRELLQQAWDLLSDDGQMLIINQGPAEAEVQRTLFTSLEIPATALGELHSVFSPFKSSRYGWVASKPKRDSKD